MPDRQQITALKDAIEGECHGLAISDEQARAILSYVLGASPPAPAPEPWGYLCNGKCDGWEERDKVVRDPESIARMRTIPDKWRIEPLYRGLPPAPAPDGWVMVPKEPTPEMIFNGHHQIDWCRNDQNTHEVEHPSQTADGIGTTCGQDILDAWRAMLSAVPAAPTEAPMNNDVIAEIAAERRRQIEVEGCTPEHDDRWIRGELAMAAATYALTAAGLVCLDGPTEINPPVVWPWDPEGLKPKDRRRDLIRAAALIVAEIERLDRAAPTEGRDE